MFGDVAEMIDNTPRPYPGLAPFEDTDTDRLRFFGRNTEAEELCHLALSQPLSVLYARSGVGKSSVLNAGVMERLRQSGVFPTMIRLTMSDEHTPTDAVILAVCAEAQKRGYSMRAIRPHGATLWEFFAFTEFVAESGEVIRPVLIMDQFEELFTVIRGNNREAEERFVDQFADLVRGRVPADIRAALEQELERAPEGTSERTFLLSLLYGHSAPALHVLLALREDYLPELESLRPAIPTIFQATYRLTALSHAAARLAIEEPPKKIASLGLPTVVFEEGVVDEIMDFLTITRGRTNVPRAEFVEPAHLQIVCAELDRRRILKQRDRITRRDLNGLKGMRRILTRHYKSALRAFPRLRLLPRIDRRRLYTRPRAAIRKLCEIGLLTKGGQRNTLMRDAIVEQFHVSDDDLQKLVKLCVLRADWRLDAQFFELSHDALLDPIRASRRWRTWRRRAAVAIGIVVGPFFLVFTLAIGVVAWQQAGLRKQLFKETSAEVRGKLFAEFVRTGLDRNLSGIDLRDTAAEGIEISRFTLDRARLSSARFDRSTISDTSLVGADIEGATFVASRIADSDFTDAHGSGSDFSAANLQADFAGADLTKARFVETSLDDRTTFTNSAISGADFSGTAWWLASGWSPEQVTELSALYPPERLLSSSAYHSLRATLDNGVVKARRQKNATAMKDALNERAWFRAIRGVELDVALNDVNDALAIERTRQILDTRGYVFLQTDKCDDALRDFSEALVLSKEFGDPPTIPQNGPLVNKKLAVFGPYVYRYALALQYTGRAEEADQWFGVAERLEYRPTHELLFLPRNGACSSADGHMTNGPTMYRRAVRLRSAS